MSKLTVKLSYEQYEMLRNFARDSEIEQAALYFVKKTQTDIIPFLFVYDPDFTSSETHNSARLEREALEAALKKQMEEPGDPPDAVVLLHTHPKGLASSDNVGMPDRLSFSYYYRVFKKLLGVELILGVATRDTVFFLEKSRIGLAKMLDLEVEGQKIDPITLSERFRIAFKGDRRPFSIDTADSAINREKADKIVAIDGVLSIPDGITRIAMHAFKKRKEVTRACLPDGVVFIGENAFEKCVNMSRINIPESVSTVDYGAFWNCRNLRSLVLPENLSSIGGFAFFSCGNLKSILIRSGVESIGKDAFYGCSDLTVYCPEGSRAHEYCIKNKIRFDVNEPEMSLFRK